MLREQGGRGDLAVIGGTGYLGRAICAVALRQGWRVRAVSRHAGQGWQDSGGPHRSLQFVAADIASAPQIASAVAGAAAVVNAVSLYRESGSASFHAVHVEGAARVARAARQAGARLVHVSGIGADAASASRYIRSRGAGETEVADAFSGAALVRPAVMFGRNDALLGGLRRLLRRTPVFPLFGRGQTCLQPVHVEDVAAAIVELARRPRPLCELAGAEALTWRVLVERVCDSLGRHPLLLPLPFAVWQRVAWLAERLKRPPLSSGQVELMRRDNLPSGRWPGLPELGIRPASLATALDVVAGQAEPAGGTIPDGPAGLHGRKA